jgi:hypothetical protein
VIRSSRRPAASESWPSSGGGSRREAARAAGVDPATVRAWLRRGERSTPEGRFGRFLADVRAAEAGQRLVGLEPDRDEVAWAFQVLERESPPDPVVVVEITFPHAADLDEDYDDDGA